MTLEVSIVPFDEEGSLLNLPKDYSKQTFPLVSWVSSSTLPTTYPRL